MVANFTKGPWRKGKIAGAIVADYPPSMALFPAPEYAEREREYYGGYLIAESISPENVSIICAAPDMYEALKQLLDENLLVELACLIRQYPKEPVINIIESVFPQIKNALAKAEGGEA